jgi:hypothetical protein
MAKATATLEVNNSGFKRGFDDMRKHAAGWSNDVKALLHLGQLLALSLASCLAWHGLKTCPTD